MRIVMLFVLIGLYRMANPNPTEYRTMNQNIFDSSRFIGTKTIATSSASGTTYDPLPHRIFLRNWHVTSTQSGPIGAIIHDHLRPHN